MDVVNLKNAKVLVVDDQPANIQLVYQVLSPHYNIFMAKSGREAIALCHKQPPDIILLDVVMPDMSGLEVCKILKNDPLYAEIPIIFITSFVSVENEIECWEAGCVDYVMKPINQLTLMNRVKSHLTLKRQTDILKRSAYLDGLTGIYNRRYFDIHSAEIYDQCKSNQTSICVALIDVDFFKRFNDCYGHLEGDACLRKVAKALTIEIGEHGFISRYGGEEFVAVLPNLTSENATNLVFSLCSRIESLCIPHEDSECSKFVTISAGSSYIDVIDESLPLSQIIEQVDKLLYESKQHGRNRVSIGKKH